MKILIADDSIVSRYLLEATLRKWGYEVVVACDGAQAWNILQKDDAPRLAILDWMMPWLTGPEVCRLVRQQARETYTYILLLTSKSQKEDLIEGMEAGADDYITKPFDQNELKVRLGPGRRIVELQTELLATREELRVQATRDSLTRLWNRFSILGMLERELARAYREVTPLGLVIGDIDHFKSINDTHGHVAGDSVLREIAHRLQASVRSYDGVGRYGGEEFLLVLPGCDAETTQRQAERLRCEIGCEPVQLNDLSCSVTISFGVTSLSSGGTASVEGLIRTADLALYQSKRQGRNRVSFLPFDGEPENPGDPGYAAQGVLL